MRRRDVLPRANASSRVVVSSKLPSCAARPGAPARAAGYVAAARVSVALLVDGLAVSGASAALEVRGLWCGSSIAAANVRGAVALVNATLVASSCVVLR